MHGARPGRQSANRLFEAVRAAPRRSVDQAAVGTPPAPCRIASFARLRYPFKVLRRTVRPCGNHEGSREVLTIDGRPLFNRAHVTRRRASRSPSSNKEFGNGQDDHVHRRQRQGRPPCRPISRRARPPGAEHRHQAARQSQGPHADHRHHRQRPGVQRAVELYGPARVRPVAAAAAGRRRRPFRRHPAHHDHARQRALPHQRDGHLQRHRGGGEARHQEDRHRLERDDLRRWSSPTSRATRAISRSTRNTTSIRWTPMRCPRSSTRRRRAPSRCAAASTSMRCASATSSSRTNTSSSSRNGSPIPASASASPGATSTRATSARSPISPSRRTGSATRSSTPPTTTRRPTCRPGSCSTASIPDVPVKRRARRIRDAALQPQGQGSARLPGRAQLAQIRRRQR